jgi:hypothetical protein
VSASAWICTCAPADREQLTLDPQPDRVTAQTADRDPDPRGTAGHHRPGHRRAYPARYLDRGRAPGKRPGHRPPRRRRLLHAEPARHPPGNAVLLSWNGPPGTHTLYSDHQPGGENFTSPYRTPQLHRDSVFTLKSVIDGQVRYNTITVAVDRPALPGLADLMELPGPAEVKLSTPLTLDNPISVTGSAEITGDFDADEIAFTGKAAIGAVTITGPVTGSGTTSKLTTPALTAVNLTTTQSLSASGNVSLFGGASFHSGSGLPDSAATDGIVVGVRWEAPVRLTASGQGPATTAADPRHAALPYHKGDKLTDESEGRTSKFYEVKFGK